MAVLLWAAFAVLAVADYCTTVTNGTNTAFCLAPSASICAEQCGLQAYEDQCLSVSGCTWNTSASRNCAPVDANLSTTCPTKNSSAECSAVTGCLWETTPCKLSTSCAGPLGSSCSGLNATACEAAGSPCFITGYCSPVLPCSGNDQNSCTSSAGCFWYVATSTSNSSKSDGSCLQCFSTPSHNIYLRMHGLVGQTCNYTPEVGFRILSAVPSATGCDGGVAMPLSMMFWQAPTVTCTSPNGPTSSASSRLFDGGSFLAVFAASLLA